jgi:ribosomal protein L3 glutamine methyltransferase
LDEASLLVHHALHLDHAVPDALLRSMLTRTEKQEVVELLGRRITERVPAPYLIGKAWFAGLQFSVDERVLVPRSPIAEWIQQGFSPWFKDNPVSRVLDMGTGSGCIAIACALAFPEARVDAVDVSRAALSVAELNIKHYGLEERVQAIESDLFDAVKGGYDLIVSNPPYVDAEELAAMPPEYRHEPTLGLAAGRDGLCFVRRIIRESSGYLNPIGVLVVEVGGARAALEREFPRMPFLWLDLEHGGDNVFLLTADQLLHESVSQGKSPNHRETSDEPVNS